MREELLSVIPETAVGARSVIHPDHDDAAIGGDDPSQPDLCCGSCLRTLVVRKSRYEIAGIVIQCRCGALNDAIPRK